MRFDHSFGYGQTKTGADRLGRRFERFEQGRYKLRWNSNAAVADSQHHFVVHAVSGETENPASRHCFVGIFDEVTERSHEARKVDIHIAVVADVFYELDILSRQEPERLLIEFVE